MESNLYIKLWESPESGYVKVEYVYCENEIEDAYKNHVEFSGKFSLKVESFEGFKLSYLFIKVKYDGRKGLNNKDIFNSLEKQGLITLVADGGLFGGYYRKTEKLIEMLQNRLNKRKELAGIAA